MTRTHRDESLAPLTPATTAIESAQVPLADRPALTCTVCIGFAAFHGDAHELMSRADAALYRAKAEGRNRVCVAD